MKDGDKTKEQLIGELKALRMDNMQLASSLEEMEEKNTVFYENSLIPMFITSIDDGNILDVNKRGVDFSGYSSKEELLEEYVPGEQYADPNGRKELIDELKLKGEIYKKEHEFIIKDGATVCVEFYAKVYPDKGWITSTMVDITQSKHLEKSLREAHNLLEKKVEERTADLKAANEKLRESEERYHKLLETANDAIFIADSETGIITDTNKKAEKLLGLPIEEIIGMHQTQLHPKEDRDYYRKIFADHVQKGEGVIAGDIFICHKNSRKIPVEVSTSVAEIGGKNIIQGIFRDITERRLAEEELKKIKDHLDNIIESSLDSIIVTDDTGYITRVNPSFLQLLGYREEEVIGKHIIECAPMEEGYYESTTGELIPINEKFYDSIKNSMKNLLKDGKVINRETYYFTKDKKVVPIEDSLVFLSNNKGERIGAVGIARDITERRKAEKEVKETKEFLETVIESSKDGIVINDENGYIISVNTAIEKMSRFKKEELIGKHISTLAVEDKDVRQKILKTMEELFEKGFTSYESQHKLSDGTLIDVDCSSSMIKAEKGDYIAGVSIIRDITERKKTEKEIKEARDFLGSIFKTSVDGIMVTDSQSVITMVNDAIEKMLGYSQDELIGRHTRELTPERMEDEERTKEFVSKLSVEGVIRGLEHTWMRKDGGLVDCEINIALLKDNKGNFTGSVGAIRDITEHKEAEKIIIEYQNRLKSLASQMTLTEEKERKRFAEYIHDQIGQQLFILKLKLEAFKKQASSNDPDEDLDNSFKIIDQIIKDTRTLTFNLSPPILYQLGLEAALEWLTEQTSEQYGIKVAFEDDEQEKEVSDDIKVLLFQAVRELLINVAKHAKTQNTKVSIKKDNNHLRVCVEDDGVGFTPLHGEDFRNTEGGFGLFSIGERMDHLGGQLEIESKPGRGTRITLLSPLKGKKKI